MKLYCLEVLNTWDNPLWQFVGVFSSLEKRQKYIRENPQTGAMGNLEELRLTTGRGSD